MVFLDGRSDTNTDTVEGNRGSKLEERRKKKGRREGLGSDAIADDDLQYELTDMKQGRLVYRASCHGNGAGRRVSDAPGAASSATASRIPLATGQGKWINRIIFSRGSLRSRG